MKILGEESIKSIEKFIKRNQYNWRRIIVLLLFLVFILGFPSALEKPWFLKIVQVFPDNLSVIVLIILFIFWVFSIAVFTIVMFDYCYAYTHNKMYKKMQHANGSIYSWLGGTEISDSYLINLLDSRKSSNNEFLNIVSIKEILANELSDSKENYMLFKNYLEFRLKNNTHNIINGYIFSIIIGALSTIFMPQIIRYFIEKNQGATSDFNYIITYLSGPNFLISIIYVIFGFGVYLAIIGIINSLSTRKRRIKYLISILDVMIQNKD